MWPHGIYLSNLTFWNKTHFVCLQPKMCIVRIVPWKRCLIFCRIWQEQHECEEVGGVWLCWGGTGKEVCTCWLTCADGRTGRGTDISRPAVINIVKAELIPGVMFMNVEVKLVICQCCFCQLCVDCSGLHSCRSEKDQQADILSRQRNCIIVWKQTRRLLYPWGTFYQNTHVGDVKLSLTQHTTVTYL